MQKIVEQMQQDTQEQKSRTDQINRGNELEKKQYQDLANAYDDYLKKLKAIGAVDRGDGTYSIPEASKDKYNQITKEYQGSVDKFNTYWKGRQGELTDYNKATMAYNQRASENNQAINDLIEKYHLTDIFKEKGLPIPNQGRAPLRDLTGAPNQIDTPPLIDKGPATISLFPLNSFSRSIAASGPPALTAPPSVASLDIKIVYDSTYRALYDERIVQLDQEMSQIVLFWQFTLNLRASQPDKIPDPFLNSKPLAQRILPEGSIAPTKKTEPTPTASTGSMMPLMPMGVNDAHLAEILGRTLLKQAIESANLKALKDKNEQQKGQKIEELTDKILLFSIGLMGNQSLQSLLPSVSPISKSLASIPADSPIFALLFAISFANRIQEDANQGINKESLQTFLNGIPELRGLPEEDLAKLEAILNLGQLLVALKLVETTLGTPGLAAQLLIPLVSVEPESVVLKGAEEMKQNQENVQQKVEETFIEQGYPKEAAAFLGKVAVQLVEQGSLTPAAPSIPHATSIHVPLFIDSIKAALVLAQIPLERADTIAHEVADTTLAETPFPSTKQLRSTLETHLLDRGIKEKAPEIARQAVIVPPRERALEPPSLPLQEKVTAAATAAAEPPRPAMPTHKPLLSPTEIVKVLEKRSLQLLVPQLGVRVAKEVTEELAKMLFGDPQPDARTVADVKAPYSLVNVIANQLYHLHLNQNKQWAEATTDSFKETIKTMESFNAFALKLMDPAYHLVNIGIMYGDQDKKKISILI